MLPTAIPPERQAARLKNATGETVTPIPGKRMPTTSRSNSALAATSAAVTPHAANARDRRHGALLSPSTTTAVTAHSATDHQPVKTTRSVPAGGGEGAVFSVQ